MSVASFFPLRCIGDCLNLFRSQLKNGDPDLVLLSIVVGAIEHSMTQSRLVTSIISSSEDHDGDDSITNVNLPLEPVLEWHIIDGLVQKFDTVIKGYCDVAILHKAKEEGAKKAGEATRALIKHVADIVWNTLTKGHYKERPHLQTIYNYLTGNKLDCFGVAYTVVAACQRLGLESIHLALSEDHAWVVFGENGTETAEVTWHGKGNEDKRGQQIEMEKAKTSWLYLAGQPVVCDRRMEVAALVSSINPGISANLDSLEVGALQQELLWLLYDTGSLKTYPMAIDNLGDLEEISPTVGRPSCVQLYEEAIRLDKEVYADQHVYPHTYQGGYFYRTKEYKKAYEAWANAADVIKKYKYSKDDEEIYKEFMEIANELIPHSVKTSDSIFLSDPECFAHLLRFYDGICCWEEGSATPVLHIGWARPMVATCSKFDAKTRRLVDIPKDEEESDDEEEDEGSSSSSSSPRQRSAVPDPLVVNNNNYYKCDIMLDDDENKCDRIFSQEKIVKKIEFYNDVADEMLVSLSAACSSRVLSVDFLLGRSTTPFMALTESLLRNPEKYLRQRITSKRRSSLFSDPPAVAPKTKILLTLYSAKMRGLKDLLCNAEKLNASAIQLQLTAQSQTDVSSMKRSSIGSPVFVEEGRPKRARRE